MATSPRSDEPQTVVPLTASAASEVTPSSPVLSEAAVKEMSTPEILWGLLQEKNALLKAQQDALAEMRKERDEAREQRASWNEAHNDQIRINQTCMRFLRKKSAQLAEKDREIERLKRTIGELDQCLRRQGEEVRELSNGPMWSEAASLKAQLSTLQKQLEEMLGEGGRGYLTVRDLCYTVFMKAKAKNDEDGGPTDWFTDTLPIVEKGLQKLRARASLHPKGESK